MSKKLPISKDIVDTNFIADESEGKFHIERKQDVTPVIEENKIKQSLGEGVSKSKELNHVASIPLVVVEQLAKQGIMSPTGDIKDHVRFKRWLNDRDNRLFRVWTGTV
jgi:hypothetical protein